MASLLHLLPVDEIIFCRYIMEMIPFRILLLKGKSTSAAILFLTRSYQKNERHEKIVSFLGPTWLHASILSIKVNSTT